MMLKTMFVGNFQGFGEHARADFSQLTLIFGPNGSGKSSLGRALRVMKQSALAEDSRAGHIWTGDEIDLGKASNAIRGQLATKNSPKEVQLGVSLTGKPEKLSLDAKGIKRLKLAVPEISYLNSEDARDNSLKMFLRIKSDAKDLLVTLSYQDASLSVLDASEIGGDDYSFELGQALQGLASFVGVKGNVIEFKAEEDYPEDVSDVFHDHFKYEHPEVEKFFEATYLAAREFSAFFKTFRHVPPIRPIPRKLEIFESEDEFEDSQANSTSEQNQASRELMLNLTGGRYSSEVRVFKEPNTGAFVRINAVRDSFTGAELAFDQVGMGLSQIAPVVKEITFGKGTSYIEQPELHLHPKLQADLMDSFIESVNTDEDRQYLLETHSESMLLRAQKRVREGTLAADKLKILYVDAAQLDDGSSFNSIQELKLDHAGDFLDPLPLSFMDIRMQDLL